LSDDQFDDQNGAARITVTPACDRQTMRIDCDDCRMQHTSVCDDCVVSFIVGREPGDAVIIDVEEERAVRWLSRAGLVPALRHEVISRG